MTATDVRLGEGGKVHESAFAVEGMFCGGCAATVERALRRMPGVHGVNVSFLGNAALVRHDAAEVDAAALRAAIARLGYAARSLSETNGRASGDVFLRDLRMRLGVAVGLGMWVMLASVARLFTPLPSETLAWWVALFSGLVSLPVLLYAGGPFLRLGWLGLRERVPGMESLILLASTAAVVASLATLARGESDVWFDVPVMLIAFQLIARLSDFSARRRAADAVREMLDLSPERARRIDIGGGDERVGESGTRRADVRVPGAASGCIESVAIAELRVGDTIECGAGERLPCDGRVVGGEATLDTALVSGESSPRAVGVGARVIGGTLNTDGVLRVRVEAAAGERRIDLLAAGVGRLLNAKSDLMRLADRVAGALVPVLVVAAIAAFSLAIGTGAPADEAVGRALATLVVSCPCALALAVPLVVASIASLAARHSVVLRDPAALEQAARVTTVIVDKTGTLTTGQPRVVRVRACDEASERAVLRAAACAGAGSSHPLMQAILAEMARAVAAGADTAEWPDAVVSRRERAGRGVVAVCRDGTRVLAGSRRWLVAEGVTLPAASSGVPDMIAPASEVCVAMNGRLVGSIALDDPLREDASPLIATLRAAGLDVVLASGDREAVVRCVGERLGIDWHAELSPEDKVALVERLEAAGQTVAFVGDGLNDGPALAAASLGIAVGTASDLARSAAAMSVLDGGLERIEEALALARRGGRTLRANLFWALLYNASMLPAAMLGFVHPVMAVFAMGASSLSVSLSSVLAGRSLGR